MIEKKTKSNSKRFQKTKKKTNKLKAELILGIEKLNEKKIWIGKKMAFLPNPSSPTIMISAHLSLESFFFSYCSIKT